MDQKTKDRMHLGVAERGKMFYLEGNHKEALRHFQEAISMSRKNASSDIFFQHYTQCVMESMELSGHHEEVLSYCEKLSAFLEEKGMESDLIQRNYATARERMGVQYALLGDTSEAIKHLEEATKTGKSKMPLSDELLGWLRRGYNVSDKQIRAAQKKHKYFIVRKDTVNPDMAIDIPNNANSVPSL